MAFGTLATSATNGSTSPGTSIAAGAVTVSVGQLAVMNFGSKGLSTNLSIADNLGQTWTMLNGPRDNSGRVITKWYAPITVAGSMTVTLSFDSTTNDAAVQLAVFDGPFTASPLDKDPVNADDSSSPYACPATGTLAQADELILGFVVTGNGVTDYAATAPMTLGPTSASATGANSISGAIGYWVVAATTTVTPTFTSTANVAVKGTSTYKQSAGKAPPPYLPLPVFYSTRRLI